MARRVNGRNSSESKKHKDSRFEKRRCSRDGFAMVHARRASALTLVKGVLHVSERCEFLVGRPAISRREKIRWICSFGRHQMVDANTDKAERSAIGLAA